MKLVFLIKKRESGAWQQEASKRSSYDPFAIVITLSARYSSVFGLSFGLGKGCGSRCDYFWGM